MTAMNDARKVLEQAEGALREIMERELRAQRYVELAELAALADGLAQLGSSRRSKPTAEAPAPTARRAPKRSKSAGPKGPSQKRKATPKSGYPRFERDGDKLVKVGWSKKQRAEYEHRTSLEVAERLLARIRVSAPDGTQFAATDVIPIDDDENPVPDYQAYLALKWLHAEGVVAKHGRDRYAVELGRIGTEGLRPLWLQLPEQKRGGAR